jgi:3',5'-cyclic AMP phosphodiesterase CpdA
MTIIAHISDLHFGAADARVVDALRAELNADPPDLVAVSGDLTQGARRWEFRAARAFLDSLTAPTLAVPGNHDITPYDLPERFLDPYRRWRSLIAPETEPLWRNGEVAVLGLNTAHRAGLHWDWSRGRVSGGRLERLLARLTALPPGLIRVVVAHHPLMPPADLPGMIVAGKAARALAGLARAGVGVVLAGHVHRAYSARGAAAGMPLIVQASTTTSVRLRGEPNAYNRIAFDPDGQAVVDTRVWTGSDWRSRDAAG